MEWGQPILPELLDQKLATGEFDTVTLIHNETSTGVMSPLREICQVVAKYPDVILIVDTVSSLSAVPIPMDELGIDVLLTGSQKAFAMPPGLALFGRFSKGLRPRRDDQGPRVLLRLHRVQKNQAEDMTPSTPTISHIFALRSKLDDFFAEGLDNRYARHARLNGLVADWVNRNGFEFFAAEGYRSKSLTCVRNNRDIDVAAMIARLKEKYHCVIDGGYGKIKGKTFRISNMGDETDEDHHAVAGLARRLPGIKPPVV